MKKKSLILSILAMLAAIALLCVVLKGMVFTRTNETPAETLSPAETPVQTEAMTEAETEPITEAETEPKVEPVTITLLAVGDLLMHNTVSVPALQADGTYNYDYLFTDTRAAIESADIACINNEVIFGGDDKGILNYPRFNGITPMGIAEVNAGFDVFTCATNHTYDQGLQGVLNCGTFWETCFPDKQIVGIRNHQETADTINIIERNGIKVALLNYTYGLNGLSVPEGYEWTVKMLTEENKQNIALDIARAREMADFIVVFPHWGSEYRISQNAEQEAWAAFFAEAGVDLVIGTHPHVCEPVEWVTSTYGRQTLVYYSLGNYVSGQYFYDTLLGGMATVAITKDETGTYISDYHMEFLVNHNEPGFQVVHTYYLRDYTDELMARHSQLYLNDPYYAAENEGFNYSVAGLKARAAKICPEAIDW